MDASSIVMALEEHITSEGSKYREGQILASAWPILLSPDTELAVLYDQIMRLRTVSNNYNTFVYKTTDGGIMGQLLYYAELNCPEQTNKILDIETSRFVLDAAVIQVKAFDALLHTEVFSAIRERISGKVAGYKELKVLSIYGSPGKDSKLRCRIFMNSGAATYTLDRFIRDIDVVQSETWDLVVNHYNHECPPQRKEYIQLTIPVKAWKSGNVISQKLLTEISNAQLTADASKTWFKPKLEPLTLTYRVCSAVRNKRLELTLTDPQVNICVDYSGLPESVLEGLIIAAQAEIEQHVVGSIPNIIKIKGANYLYEDKSACGVDYDKIEKKMQQILTEVE